MYTEFYNFTGRPFQLSPDHRFFFGSRGHRMAMAYLTFGLNERDGFIVITGDIGAGKTTLVRHLLNQLDRDAFVSASVVTSQLQADDALRMVAAAFGISYEDADKASLLNRIQAFLVDCHVRGKHVLLIVDEVQNMPFSALEELRMLSNFHHDNRTLFQCFLLGQPQFRPVMASPDLEQLRQRVIASCHLEPMGQEETRHYIEHRLKRVGWVDDPKFEDEAFNRIHLHSNGVPRRINTLCGRILLFGCLEGVHQISGDLVDEVVSELAHERGTGATDEPLTASPELASAKPVAPTPVPPTPMVAVPAATAPGAPLGYDQTINDLARRVSVLKGSA